MQRKGIVGRTPSSAPDPLVRLFPCQIRPTRGARPRRVLRGEAETPDIICNLACIIRYTRSDNMEI